MVAFGEVQLQNLGAQAASGFQGVSVEGMLNQYFGSTDLGNGINLSNVLAGIDSIEQISSGDNKQQANGVQSLVNNVMSIISKFGTGEASAAGSEVSQNVQNTNTTVTASDEQVQKIQSSFASIQKGIEAQNQIIEDENKAAEDLQAKQKAEEDKIKAAIEQINTLKSQLGGETDSTNQQALLNQITEQLGIINESITTVTGIKTELAEHSANVEKAYGTLVDYSAETQQTQSESAESLENLAAKAQQNMQDNGKTQAQAPVNQATSASAASAAAAASTNIITGSSLAPKLYRVAGDQGAAASIRAMGASTVWAQMAQGIGKISNGAELLTSYNNTIGSALNDCENLVGRWNSTISPMITSIGSVESFKAQADEFGLIVDEDKASIEAKGEQTNYVEAPAQSDETQNNKTKPQSNSFLRTSMLNGDWTKQNEFKNELLTPRAQIKFGI